MVAKSREGLQSYSRKVWVGVAKLTLQKISYNGIPFFFRNHYPNFATISLQPPPQLCNPSSATPTPTLQPLPQLCNPISATPTPTLQPLLCNPHPNLATPPLQPPPELCNPSFATPTPTLQFHLCHQSLTIFFGRRRLRCNQEK